MSDFEDDELEALEQRMREKLKPEAPRTGGLSASEIDVAWKLFTGSPRSNPYGLSEQDYMVARRLLGSTNAERLGRAQQGRRVRLAPVVTTVEWYVVKGSWGAEPNIWHYDILMNGRKEDHASGVDFDDLQQRLADFRRRNMPVKRIYLEGQKHDAETRPTGKRKTFADRFGGFGL